MSRSVICTWSAVCWGWLACNSAGAQSFTVARPAVARPAVARPAVARPTVVRPVVGPALEPHDGRPDILVPTLSTFFKPRKGPPGYFAIPVMFSATNQGKKKSGRFKLSIQARVSGSKQWFLVRFNPRQTSKADGWHVWSPSLSPNGYTGFDGTIDVHQRYAGQTMVIRVLGDSMIGDEPAIKGGRVDEQDEENNWSKLLRVRLPRLVAPIQNNTTRFQRSPRKLSR